jgi:TolB-like protein/Flp pilus assembly protein TadD
VLAVIVVAAGGYAWRSGLAPRLLGTSVAEDKIAAAPRLSIVVMPFENLSGDKEQDYFADGVTDDLTTDLSHLPDSFVISRGTAFTYKGRPIDAKQIGRELGVRYLLEGSVRRVGETVTVNAQLISTETGAHVWADRFDGERSRLGQLQVEVVARLARSLDVELVKAEALRAARERPSNPDAVDLAMQARAIMNSNPTTASLNEAKALFERAHALDPNYVPAIVGLAGAFSWRVNAGWSNDTTDDVARAERMIDAALALQPDSSMAHWQKGWILFAKRQYRAAIAEAETAIAGDPNLASAYADAGYWKSFLGRAEDGFAGIETALRLSPRDQFVWSWQFEMCHLHSLLAHWEQAIEWCDKAIAGYPQAWWVYANLAAANAWADHDQEAKDAAAQLRKAQPGLAAQDWMDDFSDDPRFKAQLARIVEGLLKAGVLDRPPAPARAHVTKADRLNDAHRFGEALSEIKVAIDIDPNLAGAYGLRGITYIFLGRAKEAIPEEETALRMSPNDPDRNWWEYYICHAHIHMAEWEQAAEWCRKSIATDGSNWYAYADLAAANGWLGRKEEAKKAIDSLLQLKPGFTVQEWANAGSSYSDNPTFLREYQGIGEGLRKAGLPEGEKKTD